MVEATNPVAGVAPEAPSIESRLTAFLGRTEEPAAPEPDETPPQSAPAEQEPAPEAAKPKDTDELTPEDIPDEIVPKEQPAIADEFEIVHDGTQHKLTRAETIELAQKGFDYTKKTQAVADQQKQVSALLAQAQSIAQAQPMLASELATVQTFAKQLEPWKNVDWVKIATDEPLEYPKYRAQYDQLVQGYNLANNQFQQKVQHVDQIRSKMMSEFLQQESAKLRQFMPVFADPVKAQVETAAVRKYALKDGYSEDEVSAITDARYVRTMWKAAQYDRLVEAKQGKLKELKTVPPVARPGAHPSRDAAKADKETELRDRLHKTGDIHDAAALLAQRLK